MFIATHHFNPFIRSTNLRLTKGPTYQDQHSWLHHKNRKKMKIVTFMAFFSYLIVVDGYLRGVSTPTQERNIQMESDLEFDASGQVDPNPDPSTMVLEGYLPLEELNRYIQSVVSSNSP